MAKAKKKRKLVAEQQPGVKGPWTDFKWGMLNGKHHRFVGSGWTTLRKLNASSFEANATSSKEPARPYSTHQQ